MAIEFQIVGLAELKATLGALPQSIIDNALPYSMRRAASIIQAEAKARAPVKTGLLKSLISVRKWKKQVPGQNLTYSIGLKGGASATYGNTRKNRRKGLVGRKYERGSNAYYWRFIEFGTEKRAAHPFLRPALDASAQRALAELVATLPKGIERALAKVKK